MISFIYLLTYLLSLLWTVPMKDYCKDRSICCAVMTLRRCHFFVSSCRPSIVSFDVSCICLFCLAAEGGTEAAISILERGEHRLPFDFALPEQCLPCSFESRVGTVRYYLRVIIDIPYASPPQGLKYFTVIGPHIDCNDDKYVVSVYLLIYCPG